PVGAVDGQAAVAVGVLENVHRRLPSRLPVLVSTSGPNTVVPRSGLLRTRFCSQQRRTVQRPVEAHRDRWPASWVPFGPGGRGVGGGSVGVDHAHGCPGGSSVSPRSRRMISCHASSLTPPRSPFVDGSPGTHGPPSTVGSPFVNGGSQPNPPSPFPGK